MHEIKEWVMDNKKFCIIIGCIFLFLLGYSLYQVIIGKTIYQSGDYNDDTTLMIKHHYEDNEYKVMRIDEVDVVERYYQMYLKASLQDIEKAYEMLSEETKSDFETIEDYKTEVKRRTSITTENNKVTAYQKKDYGYIIVDTENYQYEIHESGVMCFTITLKGQIQ